MIQKHQTACCALCQLTASNEDSFEQLRDAVQNIKNDAKLTWSPERRESGERCIFVIAAPGEGPLKLNLQKLHFEYAAWFPRRNGYPDGELEMYVLSF